MPLVNLQCSLQIRKILLSNPTYFGIISKNYSDGKSIYERNEEGAVPRTVYGKPYPEWRKPWIQRNGEWSSKLSVFNEKNPSPEILNALQNLPNLSIRQVQDWWNNVKVMQQIQNQKYLPERVVILGSNLGAAHFFTYRKAAVRLKDSKDWIAGDVLKLSTELPNVYTEGYFIEAIDCSNFHHGGIRYEGLQNLTGLNFLKWLSLKNQIHIDSFCIDRIAGLVGSSLEYLDISSCDLDVGCVFALGKMRALTELVIKDPGDNVAAQAALSFLELDNTNLSIKTVVDESNSKISDNFKSETPITK